jgi:hypothetical protein
MEDFFKGLLWLHIAAGFTGFFVAPAAMIAKKGGDWHRKWGKIYLWAMVVATGSALILAPHIHSIFLVVIAVFSFYLTFSGYRVLRRKRPDKGQIPAALDWIILLFTLAASIALLILGLLGSGALALIFGIIGILSTAPEVKKYLNPKQDKTNWFTAHMTAMIGSYIAATTAFSVTNLSFLPWYVAWLWPTVIGTVVISFWVRSYAIKFAKGKRPEELADVRIALLPDAK